MSTLQKEMLCGGCQLTTVTTLPLQHRPFKLLLNLPAPSLPLSPIAGFSIRFLYIFSTATAPGKDLYGAILTCLESVSVLSTTIV
jgi:hypothetical protein